MRCSCFLSVCLLLSACSSKQTNFIKGTATLPSCSDTPAFDLDGTRWYDNGTVTILSSGCPNASSGDSFTACALDWVFSQTGNEVSITVDEEYLIKGRLCKDKLYLQGGWWLPVMDQGSCTYEDDSAEEVAIQAEGNVLSVSAQELKGSLFFQGRCKGKYEVTFRKK